jgi:hypothetical protein
MPNIPLQIWQDGEGFYYPVISEDNEAPSLGFSFTTKSSMGQWLRSVGAKLPRFVSILDIFNTIYSADAEQVAKACMAIDMSDAANYIKEKYMSEKQALNLRKADTKTIMESDHATVEIDETGKAVVRDKITGESKEERTYGSPAEAIEKLVPEGFKSVATNFDKFFVYISDLLNEGFELDDEEAIIHKLETQFQLPPDLAEEVYFVFAALVDYESGNLRNATDESEEILRESLSDFIFTKVIFFFDTLVDDGMGPSANVYDFIKQSIWQIYGPDIYSRNEEFIKFCVKEGIKLWIEHRNGAE